MVLPLPDDVAAAAARDRLASIDIGISAPTVTALGMLAEAVVYIAGVQGSAYPRPLLSTRVVLLTGSHAGGLVAGPTPDPRNGLPLQHLAVAAGAGVVTLEWQPAAAAIELEDAITPEQMDAALRAGWDEAERAADEGIELLVLAAGGAGASTAAAAVVAAATGAEPTALLGRVVTPAGYYDDNAWMTRCLALRDALHRVRDRHGDPRTVLAALGGADIAAATGLILGAANRKTPVMIDGPVGAAAALLANDFSAQSRRWVMLPDAGRQMTVRFAAEALGLRPWLDLCLDLGEGAAALAALPMLQTALTLAGVGEPVEAMPMSRFDSTGNQIFVGVARPVEPTVTDDDLIDAESELVPDPVTDREPITVIGHPAADDTAFVIYAARGGEAARGAHAARPTTDSSTAARGSGASTDGASTDGASTANDGSARSAARAASKSEPAKAAPAKSTSRSSSGRTAAHKQVPSRTAAKSAPAKQTKSAAPAKAAPAKAGPVKAAAGKDPADPVEAATGTTGGATAGIPADPKAKGTETASDKPRSAESTAKDSAAKDSVAKDPAAKDSAPNEPTAKDAEVKDAAVKDAAVKEPAAKEPAIKEPAIREPAGKEPTAKEAGAKDSSTKEEDAKAPSPAATDKAANNAVTNSSATNNSPSASPATNATPTSSSVAKDSSGKGAAGNDAALSNGSRPGAPSDDTEPAERVGQPVAVAVAASSTGSTSSPGSPPKPRKRS